MMAPEMRHGTMRRGLIWLAAGVVVLAGLLVLTAPELRNADVSALASMTLVVFAAGVPGMVLVAAIALRSRRSRNEEPPMDEQHQ
ncbi:MAG: hypothetical protein WD358_04620 [Nitriliruptoraceae bacterium]